LVAVHVSSPAWSAVEPPGSWLAHLLHNPDEERNRSI